MHGYMYTHAYATFGIYIAILTAFERSNILVAKATLVIFNIILYIVFFFYCNLSPYNTCITCIAERG